MKTKTIVSYFGILLFWAPVLGVTAEQIVTPLWHSGFENGWPGGEWLNWRPSGPNGGSTNSATWDFIGEDGGVKPVEGTKMYKGSIWATDTRSHGAYPVLHADDHFQHSNYIVNRFYVWVDVDLNSTSGHQWVQFATWSADTQWRGRVWTLSIAGPDEDLELAHLGWDKKLSPKGDNFPMRRWVRFTVYIDFTGDGYTRVWMDGTPVYEGGGSRISGYSEALMRAHWGMYASRNVSDGVQYNDSIQIWGLSEPLADLSKEPLSPYDGAGLLGGDGISARGMIENGVRLN